jgi:RNA polymerase sigma-70 factor (family 1)
MRTTGLTDLELLTRMQSGDTGSFQDLFDRYWHLLWQLAMKKTGDAAEAEDIVQELFIDLWHKKKPVILTTTLKTYLISCLYLKVFKYFRQKGFRQKHYDDFAQLLENISASTSTEFTPAEFENEYGKLQDIIAQTIALMPQQMRTVFSLKHYGEYTTQGIADELNISPETVKTHLKIAMARLRKAGAEYPAGVLLLPLFLQMMESSY